MCQQETKDWIEDIVEKTVENYNGREVVIWGKYEIADEIKEELRNRYKIEVAFYVDGDITKIDEEEVFSPDCLFGKSDKYYVIIPLAYYQEIKEKLTGRGYEPHKDYYYFCDCILRQEADYFEDAHGNKIIGSYQGLKFAFTGFGSAVNIGAGVGFEHTSLYIHSGAKLVIEDGAQLRESIINMAPFAEANFRNELKVTDSNVTIGSRATLDVEEEGRIERSSVCIHNGAKFVIEEDVVVEKDLFDIAPFGTAILGKGTNVSDCSIVIGNQTTLKAKKECCIRHAYIRTGKKAELALGHRVFVSGWYDHNEKKTTWDMRDGSKLVVGDGGRFQTGICWLGENAVLKIGKAFSVNEDYRIVVNMNSNIFIGNDCMLSYDIKMRSSDGHSIFEVETGRKINPSYEGDRARKIVIGNHVWIGERCELLYNTQIGDGSIIGAMSLVKGIIPNNCIAAGIPAKVIRKNIAWSRKEGAGDIAECGKKNINYTVE